MVAADDAVYLAEAAITRRMNWEAEINMPTTNKRCVDAAFAAAGAAMTILFLLIVNLVTYSNYLWFVYPSFAVLWWPISVIFAPRSPRVFSVVGSFMILVFLTAINLMFSPSCLWVLYAAFPVVCWPVLVFLGRRAGRLPVAAAVSILAAVYYILLNKYCSPGFLWFIFPMYAVMWWPLAIVFAKRGNALSLSLAGTIWSILFFAVLNAVTTPFEIWAVYPIFALLWWPLSVFCFVYKRKLS
jgi:hypothetical protein